MLNEQIEPMKVLSVNVGQPRDVQSDGKTVLTSIFKTPVQGRIPVRDNNLAGDRQSDPRVHGGRWKAIYAYPSEHYPFWMEQLGVHLSWGSFGENLTIEGLVERDVHVGDRLRIGSTELVVSQPRMPCYKLGIRFDDPLMVKRFLDSRRSGFYFSVAVEGDIGVGDSIEVLARNEARISIPEILRLYIGDEVDPVRLQQAIELPALSDAWRGDLRKRLAGST